MRRKLTTARFGEIHFDDQDIIGFSDGIPGFEKLKSFLLIEGEEFEPFRFIQAVNDPNISFPILRPQEILSDYRVELPAKQRELLDLGAPEEAVVFCVVTIDEDPARSSINLFAPIIVNLLKRKAAQVILFGSPYRVDTPLLKRN